MRTKWKIPAEYLQILKTDDAIEALEKCRSAIKQAKRESRKRARTLLGITATMHRRVSRTPQSWRTFTEKDFWNNCSGERPTMANRSDGLRFVVRYAENAISREAAQNASRHTTIIQHLLNKGLKPGHMPGYLAKRGQGMEPTQDAVLRREECYATKVDDH
jgi:hypothetical protein